jgi:hypothetical protein
MAPLAMLLQTLDLGEFRSALFDWAYEKVAFSDRYQFIAARAHYYPMISMEQSSKRKVRQLATTL